MSFGGGIIKGLGITIKHIVKKPITVQYPKEKLIVPKRYRALRLYIEELCTGCEMCLEVCPNGTITIKKEDGRRNGKILEYNHDFNKCMFCGLCVEICPTGALYELNDYEYSQYSHDNLFYTKEKFKELEKRYPEVVEKQKKTKLVRGSAVVFPESCIGCLMCKKACDWFAVYNIDVGNERKMQLDYDACTYCGRCSDACPTGVLKIKEFRKREDIKTWKSIPIPKLDGYENYFEQLKAKVIDAEICSHCSACVAVCPVDRIVAEDKPIHDNEIPCINCAMCNTACPRYEYVPESGVGSYLKIFGAKSKRFSGQDGGMVTEIFATAKEVGLIDAAVVVDKDEEFRPVLKVTKSVEEIAKASGTKYIHANTVSSLKTGNNLAHVHGIGIVGTPCQCDGFRSIEKSYPHIAEKTKLVVALFCTENFFYHELFEKFLKGKGIDAKNVTYTDISKGKLYVKVLGEEEPYTFPVKELEEYVFSGCLVCQDFSGISSDVSVGSVGSKKGFSTVIVRSEKVLDLFEYMEKKGYIEVDEAKVKVVENLCKIKVKLHPYPRGEKHD